MTRTDKAVNRLRTKLRVRRYIRQLIAMRIRFRESLRTVRVFTRLRRIV